MNKATIKNNAFNEAHVLASHLKLKMDNIERIDPEGAFYISVCRILDAANNDALEIIWREKIRFISNLALNRLIRRGVKMEA